MQDNWVDFKAIKAAVTIEAVLDHYKINWLRKKDDELTGRCPIHEGEGQSSFHVNLSKNAFHCFSCKAHGNVLDFVAAMEKCTVRDAALKIAKWFTVGGEPEPPPKEKPADTGGGVGDAEAASNKPLGFQLKSVDYSHPYLAERGISREVAELFGVGFYSGKGSMNGRVVIPIHNERGELVAYAGRSIDGSEPRYKLPAGFHKSLELFNLHRMKEGEAARPVIIVEGFFDCIKVHQAGFPNVVALMGSTLSMEQCRLFLRFRSVVLMLDGDEPGVDGIEKIAARLMHSHFVRVASLGRGIQPDQLSTGQLQEILRSLQSPVSL